MMRLKIVAPIVIAVAAVVAAGAYLAVYGVSLNRFKGDLAAEVKDATGRDLSIGGDLRLWLLWRSLTPKITADEIAFGNASWGSRPTMFGVDRMEVEFDPLRLLRGEVDVKRLALTGVDLLLEDDRRGRGNWELGVDEELVAEGQEYALEELPVIRLVRVENLNAAYHSAESGKTTTAKIDVFQGTADGLADPISFDLKAKVNGEPVDASGTVGSIKDLLDGKKFSLAVSASAAQVNLGFEGSVGDLSQLSGIDVQVKASGPELAGLSRMASIELPQSGRFDISGRLTGSASEVGVEALTARFDRGGLELNVGGRIGNLAALSGIDIKVALSGAEFAALAALLEWQIPKQGPFKIGGGITGSAQDIVLEDLLLRIERGDLRVALDGGIGAFDAFRLDLRAKLSGAEFAGLGPLVGVSLPAMGPFEIAGGFMGSEQDLVLRNLVTRIERNDLRLTLNGGIGAVDALDRIDLQAKFEIAELAGLGPLVGVSIPDMGPFDVSGKVAGSPSALNLTGITAILTGLTLTLDGTLGGAESFDKVDLTFNLAGDSLSELQPLVPATLPALGPLELSGRFTRSGHSYAIEDFNAIVGGSDARGSISAAFGGKPKVAVVLTSGVIDLMSILASLDVSAEEAAEAAESKGLLSDEPLPFDLLHAVDADVRLDIEQVLIGEAELRLSQLVASLADGRLTIDPYRIEYRNAPVSGELEIDAAAEPAVALKILVQNFDLGRLLKEAKVTDLVKGEIDVGADLKGKGESLRAIVGNLDGTASFVMGQGEIASRYVDLIAADLLQFLMPWKKSVEETPIKCVLGQFVVKEGVAESKALLFDTQGMIMAGKGSIDLSNEKVDFLLSPRPKDPSLFSLATDLRVTGPLDDTSVYPDPAHLLIEAAEGAAGYLVLGPLGILIPFASLGAGDNHPCVNDLQKEFGKTVAVELRHQPE